MGKSVYIPINQISLKKSFNPRPEDDDGFEIDRMNFIYEGIRDYGLNAALVVTPEGKNTYTIVAGERRYRSISRLVDNDIVCYDPITDSKRSAKEVYIGHGVECKIQMFKDDVERKIVAIQENVLHEPLSDYALLMQLQWLKENGIKVPAEQGKILARSVAWISQSHNLLRPEKKKILEYIKLNKMTRTGALNFINIPDDQIESVLEEAMKNATRNWEMKLEEANVVCKTSSEEIGINKAILSVASFMGDPNQDIVKNARRNINKAKQSYTRSKKTVDKSATDKPTITDAGIIQASRSLGAAENINKPRTPADLRKIYKQAKDDQCIDGLTDEEYRGAMALARWMLDCSGPENISELLDAEGDYDDGEESA